MDEDVQSNVAPHNISTVTEKENQGDVNNDVDDDDDDDDDDELDNEEETWSELDAEWENVLTCLFCDRNFKTMAVALEHCMLEHKFNLSDLKNKFSMDCYSYICMINYVRREKINSETLLAFKEPPWLDGEYLVPVMQDDPWLMFDFDGLELPTESINVLPMQSYHVVNSENGLVTLTEQHFAQLQHEIKHLALQVESREAALILARDQIDKMKAVTQNLVCSELQGDADTAAKVAKISSWEDRGYFGSYAHFGIHHDMLMDNLRTTKYRNAIQRNSELFVDKIVLDVGCGTGILSMFAAAVGASKVYGVDNSEIIFNAMDIIRENNFGNQIELIRAKVEDASLPVEKVDVIISEWMGYFLLYEGMLESVVAARDKYLKPGGLLLPNRCLLFVTGISDPEMHQRMLGFWSDVYGFKMSCLAKHVTQEAHVLDVPSHAVATTSSVVFDVDLSTVSDGFYFDSDFSLESTINGDLTALCGHFDAIFDLPNPEVLSTSPKGEKTHWKQTVFFFQQPVPVTAGCTIKGKISCKRLADDNRALKVSIILEGQRETEYFLT